jgi:alpha-mannosidase II
VEERSRILLDQYRKKSQLYGAGDDNHGIVLVPLGDDFRYVNLNETLVQFENYEKLMNYMNSRSDWNVNIKFGTLKDYFDVLVENKQEQQRFETFSGDFFTYADRQDHYWSGYYTSRVFYKRLDRVVQSYLRNAEIAFSLSNLLQTRRRYKKSKFTQANELYAKILVARRNLGLFQHHDGITGTARVLVVQDYSNKYTQYNFFKASCHVVDNTV